MLGSHATRHLQGPSLQPVTGCRAQWSRIWKVLPFSLRIFKGMDVVARAFNPRIPGAV